MRIGNSRGIRIPRTVIEQCGFGSLVELEVREGCLVVRPVDRRRLGWDDAFRRMAEQGDDELLDRGSLPATEWDRTEWEW